MAAPPCRCFIEATTAVLTSSFFFHIPLSHYRLHFWNFVCFHSHFQAQLLSRICLNESLYYIYIFPHSKFIKDCCSLHGVVAYSCLLICSSSCENNISSDHTLCPISHWWSWAEDNIKCNFKISRVHITYYYWMYFAGYLWLWVVLCNNWHGKHLQHKYSWLKWNGLWQHCLLIMSDFQKNEKNYYWPRNEISFKTMWRLRLCLPSV